MLRQDAAVKYAFIQSHEKKYPIAVMCRVLNASRSGYNAGGRASVSQRIVRQQDLLKRIKTIFQRSHGTYGSPRILRELRKEGIVVNHKTMNNTWRDPTTAVAE